ncbi:MAG TPA: hypothetical protein VHC18_16365 [Amycolatopsis sp.]|nr:hypothetical protein [Amycolatopsis sp.]
MRRTWWLPVGAAIVSVLTFLVAKDSLTDDGYITLAYAKNLALHGEWALIPGHPANTATSPLNVALLGFVSLLTRVSGSVHPVIALGIVNALAGAAIGWAWARMRLPTAAAVLGTLVVLLNPLLLSALGLEVVLIAAMVILLVSFARQPVAFGVLSGLTLLTRLDLIVFVVLIGLSSSPVRRHVLRVLGLLLLVALPWHVFSWFYFGSALPDTLVIKQLQPSFGKSYFQTGIDQMWHGNELTTLSFAPAELGVLILVVSLCLRRFGPMAALGLGGIAYYAVYSVLGVPAYHWYYVPPIVALAMSGAGIAGGWANPARAVVLTLVGLLIAGYIPAGFLGRGFVWSSPPFFGNWASAKDYARVGLELKSRLHGAGTTGPGEIGTLAYFCDCTIVDGFADRGLLGPSIHERIDRAGPVGHWLLRLNYARFDWSQRPIPLGYQMRYEPGPGAPEWTVSSVAKGVGHFVLVPIR